MFVQPSHVPNKFFLAMHSISCGDGDYIDWCHIRFHVHCVGLWTALTQIVDVLYVNGVSESECKREVDWWHTHMSRNPEVN